MYAEVIGRLIVKQLLFGCVFVSLALAAHTTRKEKAFSVTIDPPAAHSASVVKKQPPTNAPQVDSGSLAKENHDTIAPNKSQFDSSVKKTVADTIQQKTSVNSSPSKIAAIGKGAISIAKNAETKPVSLPRHHSVIVSGIFKLLIFILSLIIIIAAVIHLRRRGEQNRFMTTTRLSIMDKEIQRACRYIEMNFKNPQLSVEYLCNELVTGKAFLEALFERDLGISVAEFIDQVRINRAKVLLGQDEVPGTDELAFETGFTDENTFLQTFKRVTGAGFETYLTSVTDES